MISANNPGQPFKSAHRIAVWAVIFLKLYIVLDVIAIFSSWLQLGLLSRVAEGNVVTYMEARGNDSRQQLIGGAAIILFIITGIVVLRWIYFAYRNLSSLGAVDLRFTPRWALGFFFFPLLNLFRPFQAVSEIWKASNPQFSDQTGTGWKSQRITPVLTFWWIMWLSSDILGTLATQVFVRMKTLDSLQTATWLSMLDCAANGVAAILLIRIIEQVDKWQQERSQGQDDGIMQYNTWVGAFDTTGRTVTTGPYAPAISHFSVRRVPARLPGDITSPSG